MNREKAGLKLCFIADGRSPHSRNWIHYLIGTGHEIHLISTYPCDAFELPLASLQIVPLDFSAKARASIGGIEAKTTHGSPLFARLRGGMAWKTLAHIRDQSAPWAVRLQSGRVRKLIEKIDPDLVHSMRIPFEGILASRAVRNLPVPLVMSVWGIDFTYTAAASRKISRMISQACARADALHPDCRRDLRLALQHGFGLDRPVAILPGNGGVKRQYFHLASRDPLIAACLDIPSGVPVILNPRGVKPYIRTENFFRAIPLILLRRPDCIFLCAMMAGNSMAEGLVNRLGIAKSVRLLDYVPQAEMAKIFRLADIAVSASDHDGTPNTLLEAMACGAFPIAGNIESVREWIVDGINGLLCDQERPESIADAILHALDDDGLRTRARELNSSMIAERVDYHRVMAGVPEFYTEVIRDVRRRSAIQQ